MEMIEEELVKAPKKTAKKIAKKAPAKKAVKKKAAPKKAVAKKPALKKPVSTKSIAAKKFIEKTSPPPIGDNSNQFDLEDYIQDSPDLSSEFSEFADDGVDVNTSALPLLNERANRVIQLQEEKQAMEDQLKEINIEINSLLFTKIPEAMAEANMREFTTVSNHKIEIVDDVQVSSIVKRSQDDQQKLFDFIAEQGDASIIKHVVMASFGKGDDAVASKVVDTLKKMKVPAVDSMSIPPQTYKSWIKEKMSSEEGMELVMKNIDLLGIKFQSFATVGKKA